VLKTQEDILKDEPGSGELEEGASQQEIGVSMADEQESVKSIPDASVSINTQTPMSDKKKSGLRA
jgi:hypothetical protein